jgi:hypothetical protein
MAVVAQILNSSIYNNIRKKIQKIPALENFKIANFKKNPRLSNSQVSEKLVEQR